MFLYVLLVVSGVCVLMLEAKSPGNDMSWLFLAGYGFAIVAIIRRRNQNMKRSTLPYLRRAHKGRRFELNHRQYLGALGAASFMGYLHANSVANINTDDLPMSNNETKYHPLTGLPMYGGVDVMGNPDGALLNDDLSNMGSMMEDSPIDCSSGFDDFSMGCSSGFDDPF